MGSPLTEHAPRRIERHGEAPQRRIRSTQEMLAERSGPGTATIVARTLLGLLAVLLVLAAVFLVARALEPASSERAPWAAPGAPDVPPPPLGPQ